MSCEGGTSAKLTAEMIVDHRVPDSPRVSPDGRLVVFVVAPANKRGEHPETRICLARTDSSDSARKLTAGVAHNHAPCWSPDGRFVFFLSDRDERDKAQLYRLPMEGGEAERLTKWKAGIGDFAPLPGGETVALLAKDEPTEEDQRRERERDDADVFGERWPYARLRLLDLGTREIDSIENLGDRHVAEVAPDPSGKSLAVVTWPTPELDNWGLDNELHVVDTTTGETSLGCALESGGHSLIWGGEGRKIFFLGSASPRRITGTALFSVDLSGNEPRMLTGNLPACPVALCRGRDDEADPLVAVARGLDTTLERLDPESGDLTRLSHHPGGLWTLDTSDDGRTIATLRSASDEPEEVWAGPPEGPLRKFTDLNPELQEVDWGEQERLYWTASDGLELDGLLILPPGKTRDDGPFPLVTSVHGGPYGRWDDSFQLNWGQWFATEGYAVFMPNPRGGMGHGHEFAARVAGAVGKEDYADIIAGIDRLVEEDVADPERLGIGGWSQGGFMTAWAVGQTDRFKAGIMGAGVSDWGAMVAESDMPRFEAECGGSTGWEGPGPHRHDSLSPISFAYRVKTPVLILHSQNDERVPVGQARYFARALRHHGCPFEFVTYPREPHGVQERSHQRDILRRSRAWFDRWMSPQENETTSDTSSEK